MASFCAVGRWHGSSDILQRRQMTGRMTSVSCFMSHVGAISSGHCSAALSSEQTEYLVIHDLLERRQPIRTSACVDHWRRGSGNGNLALNLETSNSVHTLNMARTTL